MTTKQDRLDNANELIKCIASCGRRFFLHGDVSYLEIDYRGRIWFYDSYSRKRIYTHYKGRWQGFTRGGALKDLIERLRDYISKGKQIHPIFFCDENHWGYGNYMRVVREKAIALGIIEGG